MRRQRTEIHRREYGTVFVTEGAFGQSFVVASLSRSDDTCRVAARTYTDLADLHRSAAKEIVHERIFGSLSIGPAVMAARREALEARGFPSDNPVTYIQGRPPWGEGLAGVMLRSVSGVEGPWPIPHGRKWLTGSLTFLILQNIKDVGGVGSRADEARHMIERAEKRLREEGATYFNVVRTWFYLADILDWYDEFNEARNAKYSELGILPGHGMARLLLPASTGIQGDTPQATAGVLDLLALVEPAGTESRIRQLRNVGQEDAFRYGSAFSRGALISSPDVSMIEVSGTASIDESGKSVHRGDFSAQAECTLDKIASLLEPEGARLEDFSAATVFVKHAEDAPRFEEIAKARGLEDLPAVCVVADVCREELLFEMDGSVVVHRER